MFRFNHIHLRCGMLELQNRVTKSSDAKLEAAIQKVSLRVSNSMAKFLFYNFRVTNSRLKNKNFHFQLLA